MAQDVTVAAAHVAPIFLNAKQTTEKACEIISAAGQNGIDLIVFPESFIPGFPLWAAISAPIHNHGLFTDFARESIRVPGPEILSICTAARDANIIVSMGFSESSAQSVGCLWNSNILIGTDGSIMNHHRKLVPTFFEKLIWANGDGCGLRVVESDKGKIGALICGENTNPLARFSLMAQGEQIHLSTYPPTWPTHEPSTNERYDLAEAIRIRAGAHSFEAKAFNVVAASRVDENALDRLGSLGEEKLRIIADSPRGVSMVVGPNGLPLKETSSEEDFMLVETIDLEKCVVPKQFHDVVGYYNRFDVFDLKVNRHNVSAITFEDGNINTRDLSFSSIEKTVNKSGNQN